VALVEKLYDGGCPDTVEAALAKLGLKGRGGTATRSRGKTKGRSGKAGGKGTRRRGKRPLSGYMKFAKEKRGEVVKTLGAGAGVTDVAKELGKRWRAMSEKEKKSY